MIIQSNQFRSKHKQRINVLRKLCFDENEITLFKNLHSLLTFFEKTSSEKYSLYAIVLSILFVLCQGCQINAKIRNISEKNLSVVCVNDTVLRDLSGLTYYFS